MSKEGELYHDDKVWIVKPKRYDRIVELISILGLEEGLTINHNAGFGVWFPGMIKMKGNHYDYYKIEFAELISLLLQQFKELS